jgi:hypothetical protein
VKPRSAGIALALTVFALLAGPARGASVEVVVVDRLDLAQAADEGAVGLIVPGWGDTVSRESALAALRSGRVYNSRRVGASPSLVDVREGVPSTPAAATTILLELPRAGTGPNDRRYPVAVIGHGYHGLLTSASTRIDGLVSIADVAPTALVLADEPVPDGVTGHVLATEASSDPVAALARLDHRLTQTRENRLPAAAAYGGLLGLLALLGLLGSAAAGRAVLLALPAAATASLALALAGTARWWVFLPVDAVLALGGGLLARRRTGLGLLCLGAIAFQFVGLAWWHEDVALSLLGPNPDAGGRFFGLSNELETLLALSGVVAAALLWERGGAAVLMVVGGITLLTVEPDRLGSSVTGAIVIAVGFAVLSVALERMRGLLPAAVVGAAAAAMLFLAPPAHLAGAGAGRLLSRLELSARLAVGSPSQIVVTFALGVAPLVLVAALYPRLRLRLAPPEAAALLAVLVATGVSLVVNDSPGAVLSHGAGWALAIVAFGLAASRSVLEPA